MSTGIAAAFIVLDKVDTGFAELAHEIGRVRRRKTDIRLDDGSDQRPVMHTGELACSGNTVDGPLEAGAEFRGPADSLPGARQGGQLHRRTESLRCI